MTYVGRVEKGVVVFDSPRPPEGAAVRVEEVSADQRAPTWKQVFADLIGAAEGLPEDLAQNHGRCIRGVPPNQKSEIPTQK